jgi:hypothetical protein
MSQWYLLRGDQTQGPYEEEQVREWARTGQVAPTDLLCPVGADQWQPLQAHPEFAAAASLPATAPAPQPGFGSGLGAWITTAWNAVSTDPWAFIGATVLMMLVSMFTLGICGPPLQIGLLRMILKKLDGRPVQAGDVFEGFSFFGPAWGLTAIILVPLLLVLAPFIAMFVITARSGNIEQTMPMFQLIVQGFSYLFGLAVSVISLFAWPLIAERRAGPWEALCQSWAAIRTDFWTCLLAVFIFGLIANVGAMLCCVGMLFSLPLQQACIVALYRSRFPVEKSGSLTPAA